MKEEKALMSVLMEEKERSSSEVGSTLIKQKEQFELACKELERLTDETRHLERYKVEKSILEQK